MPESSTNKETKFKFIIRQCCKNAEFLIYFKTNKQTNKQKSKQKDTWQVLKCW